MVAVKAFRLDLLPEDVARLAESLRRLNGTIGHIGAGLEGTTAYLAMNYYAAETLDVALRHLAPAPLDTALPLLRAMADVIDQAWEAGPQNGHGALHPRDVFVTTDTNEVHITGFGVAPALESIGARSQVRRPYTAPERGTGAAWDSTADTFSLAAIAHELLTGRRPAGPGEQDGALPAAIPAQMRVHIRRVLSKALAQVPAQRYTSCREFVEALSDRSSMPEPEVVPPPAVESSLPLLGSLLDPLPASSAPVLDLIAEPSTQQVAAAAVARRRARVNTPQSKSTPSPEDIARPEPRSLLDEPAVDMIASRRVEIADDAPLELAQRAPIGDMVDARSASTVNDPIDSAPIRIDVRQRAQTPIAPSAPMPLPSNVPWAPIAAVVVATAILSSAATYHYLKPRLMPAGTVVPATAVEPAAPAQTAAKPAVPASTDTEVTIPDAAPKTTEKDAAAGRVIVRSTPAGASVTIDGKVVGRTPVTARELSLNAHTVLVSRSGFQPESRKITLSAADPSATVTVTLSAEQAAAAKAPAASSTGSLSVDSRPRAARVTIDGRSIGATPIVVPALKPGTHSVRVEMPGYKMVTTTVVVKAGETAKLALTLEK